MADDVTLEEFRDVYQLLSGGDTIEGDPSIPTSQSSFFVLPFALHSSCSFLTYCSYSRKRSWIKSAQRNSRRFRTSVKCAGWRRLHSALQVLLLFPFNKESAFCIQLGLLSNCGFSYKEPIATTAFSQLKVRK